MAKRQPSANVEEDKGVVDSPQPAADLGAWTNRYEAALYGSGHVLYDWDSRSNRVTYAGNIEEFLGYAADEVPTGTDEALGLTHPDDRGRFDEAIKHVAKTKEPFRLEYRMRKKDGTYITVQDHAHFYVDGTGTARMVGFIVDVSDRVRAQERTAALLEVAKDISGTVDRDEILARVQRRTAAVLPCDVVATFSLDPQQQLFRVIAHHGVRPDVRPAVEALTFPPGALGGHLANGQTIFFNDVHQQPWLPVSFCEHFGVAALIAAPLRVRGHQFGALVAIRRAPAHAFDAAQVELCEGIARQLAIGLEATELYRVQQEEAEIAAALARVGREMMSVLSTPLVLTRLCQLTTEVLGCDCSHTLLWKAAEEAYVPVSGYGDTAEQWEAMRVLRVPREVASTLVARLERDEVVQAGKAPPGSHPMTQVAEQYGITHSMFVALRRGSEFIGYHAARYRGRPGPFTPRQERLARGIAHIASLAMENARLVEELERAGRLKSDFVAIMSHELRTPLNVIIGYNDLMRDEVFGPLSAEQRDTLQRIDQSSHQLLELINITLDVSRLENRRVPLAISEVSVGDLLTEVEAETRDLREKPGLRFAWHVPQGLPRVRTDPTKLKVVLKNLIGNAVKFTEQGSVTVGVRTGKGAVEFTVSDTGIGMPSDASALIFEPFRQLDGSMTRRYGGVGLGLYIVQRLTDMLGGSVTFDSELGRGSTFRVSLPLESES